MLRITITNTPTEQRLVLEGRLVRDGLLELESAWKKARLSNGKGSFVVDLRNITFIDQSAERVLLDMNREGALFLARGVSNTYRLAQLGIKCKSTLGCQSVGGAPAC